MDIGLAIRESWDVLRRYPFPLVIGYMLLSFINSVSGGILAGNMLAGFAELAEKGFRGEEPKLEEAFRGFDRFVDKLLVGLVIIAGSLACGIGVLVTWFLFLYAPIIVQTKAVDWQTACRQSKDLVVANVGGTLLLVLTIFGLNLLGTLACCFGTIVTAPLSMMVVQRCYHQLTETE